MKFTLQHGSQSLTSSTYAAGWPFRVCLFEGLRLVQVTTMSQGEENGRAKPCWEIVVQQHCRIKPPMKHQLPVA